MNHFNFIFFTIFESVIPFAAAQDSPCIVAEMKSGPLGKSSASFSTLSDAANEAFVYSPGQFTRKNGLIKEGAVYGEDGMVICILKDDPAAYVYKTDPQIEKLRTEHREKTSDKTLSINLCDQVKAKSNSLTLSNGDFLNRLQWSISEGNCNPTISARFEGKNVSFSPNHTPIYYQGFVLNNLRKKFKSENEMLRRQCNSGPGKDYYEPYFVSGRFHAKQSFALIAKPFSWQDISPQEAFKSQDLDKKIRYCVKDLFASVSTPEISDPTHGRSHWNHAKGCYPDDFAVKFDFLGNKDTYCCYTK